MLMRFALTATCLVAIVGCASANHQVDGASYRSTTELAAALTTAHLGCTDLNDKSRDDLTNAVPEPWVAQFNYCTVGDQAVKLRTFADAETRAKFITLQKSLGCSLAPGQTKGDLWSIYGPDWEVQTTSQPVAQQVARALGGITLTIACHP
jgi:hypothetical protein